MLDISSPVTSEIRKASTLAPLTAACCAILPPRIAERCLRTTFICAMGAPECNKAWVVSRKCSIDKPCAGRVNKLDPPPEINTIKWSLGFNV